MTRRPDEVSVRFEIRPVGDFMPGMPAVPPNGLDRGLIAKRNSKGEPASSTSTTSGRTAT